jgi:hypothetical protein
LLIDDCGFVDCGLLIENADCGLRLAIVIDDCRLSIAIAIVDFESALNQQSSISILNPQSQSAIRNLEIANHQSPIRNRSSAPSVSSCPYSPSARSGPASAGS